MDSVEIRWPSGRVDKLSNLPIDNYIKVKEGEGVLTRRNEP
ncbi:MAG: ASPIC/UnbV domain-containing protein [Pyrinomonadaceae bacterium]